MRKLFLAAKVTLLFNTLTVFIVIALLPSAWAYKQATDTSGGNARLAVRVYDVYIANDPKNPASRDEVVGALQKWQTALAGYGITLTLRAGDPPATPIDRAKFQKEVEAYARDPAPNPDMSKYPEIQKSFTKGNTLSVYFRSTEEIQKMGKGTERGRINWLLNADQDRITSGDIFLPNDKLGGAPDVAKILVHNIAMHEIGHFAGFDHYTKAQQTDGQVMQLDASLFTERLALGVQETNGLKAIYGQQPNANLQGAARQQSVKTLPPEVQSRLPAGLDDVWQYTYEIQWGGYGEDLSYLQVEIGSAPIYFATGLDSVADWMWQTYRNDVFNTDNGTDRLYEARSYRGSYETIVAVDDLLEFYADNTYIGASTSFGKFVFYTDRPPSSGLLITAAGTVYDTAPLAVPAPGSLALVALGLFGVFALAHRSPGSAGPARYSGGPQYPMPFRRLQSRRWTLP